VTPEAIEKFLAANLSEERFDAYLADPDRAVFVAVDGAGDFRGYTLLVMGEPYDADVAAAITTRPTCELSKLYVHPDAHGVGLAPRLVEATAAEARARGAAGMWLGVNQHNARANRFYEKTGFVRVGVKRFLVGDRFEDDFVRELDLSSSSA